MPRPSNNPFTPEQPVTEEERFFGREDVVEWIDDRFLAGQRFVVVYGTPRIGKTSLLFRLRPRLANKGLSAYVDLDAFPQDTLQEALWHLVAEVHRQLGQGREGVPPLVRAVFLSRPDYVHEKALPLWRQISRDRDLVLLLDGLELAQLKEGIWAELVLRLREIVAEERDLYVVATVRGSSARATEPVPALRGLPYWDLDCLSEDQTEELLVGMARYQLGFDYDAIRRIHLWTGGHPYLVQVFGAELYRRLAPYGQVTIHVVNELVPLVVAAAGELFAGAWEELAREEQITLAAVGSLQGYRGSATPWDLVVLLRRSGLNRTLAAVEQSLQELRSRHVMRWFGGSGYVLRMELWRAWLASAHPLPEVLHGKRGRRRQDEAVPRRRPTIDWSALLLWMGIGLAILLVARFWSTRGSRLPEAIPVPTAVIPPPTPRPTPTRVLLPGYIAYMARATAHEPWSIWVMRDDGTDPVCLSDGNSEDTMPAWSPDGTRLAFVSNRSGSRDIWIVNADGTLPENITRSASEEWTPAWSPDGLDIAFASNRDGNWELYIAKAGGSAVRRVTWHPAADYAPSWSPDGGQLAFVSERDGNKEIYVVNRDGTGLQRLTSNQVTDLSPHWSRDGQLIVFESYRDGNMEIYTMAPDGSDVTNVGNKPDSDEHGPRWSPDGKWITYYSNRDGSWDIFIMRADGSQKTNLTAGPAIEQAPAWQPQAP